MVKTDYVFGIKTSLYELKIHLHLEEDHTSLFNFSTISINQNCHTYLRLLSLLLQWSCTAVTEKTKHTIENIFWILNVLNIFVTYLAHQKQSSKHNMCM